MRRSGLMLWLALAVCAAVAGCAPPTAPYDKGRALLSRSRQKLVEGDSALTVARFDQATDLYSDAAGDLKKAVACLETAERDVEATIRQMDAENRAAENASTPAAQNTVVIGARDVSVDRFYAETLRGYREALAQAVVMRAVALERLGEAHYRGAAAQIIAGDQYYPAEQYAAAEKAYTTADEQFRKAMATFGETSDFAAQRLAGGNRLAAAAPAGVWPILTSAQGVADHRRVQTDAYLAATAKRILQAGRIVEAYRVRDPGNVPTVTVSPLEPLPDIVRRGVVPPPIPSAATRPLPALPPG